MQGLDVKLFIGAVLSVICALQVFSSQRNEVYLPRSPLTASRISSTSHALRSVRVARSDPSDLRTVPKMPSTIKYQPSQAAASTVNRQRMMAFIGFLLTAMLALFFHKQVFKPIEMGDWVVASADCFDNDGNNGNDAKNQDDDDKDHENFDSSDDEELEPEELFQKKALEAREDYQVGSQTTRLAHFPGQKGLVNLVELYKEFDELLNNTPEDVPQLGARVTGTISSFNRDGVFVNLGGKTIGFCPREELAILKVKCMPDVVDVGSVEEFDIIATHSLVGDLRHTECVLLSKRSIAEELAWNLVRQYWESDIEFNVTLRNRSRFGYSVEVEDLCIPAFLPLTQASSDLATTIEFDEEGECDTSTFEGQVIKVRVFDLDIEKERLVVSQRALNVTEVDAFQIGSVHEGTVQSVKTFGAFVDINGTTGLLHVSHVSHIRVNSMETVLKVGDKIKCMVLSQDSAQGRISLSTKRLEPTPGDMLTNPQLVFEKAEEMAERFRQDMAAAEKRMQEFEAKLEEQSTVAFG
eukprot:GGOE01000795.1.p1 GENE.GGOE01000795.1~~GGOE01000795.1.p1  ORF type:complete len:524 (-),score=81.01 GGOE01000795.1:279-1850(-)